ncbi:hypothetical protein F4775DRAFT_605356 [Biscogniauxia sp. FL1348]|nr:hypothetical protein F4775DRAFT_605356 [Biscogniauxia sp. FL1348]
MSRQPEPGGEGGHVYGFPNRAGRDRYLQNIIDHTSNTFPHQPYELPRLKLSSDADADDREPSFEYSNNYHGSTLDAYDRSLLGRSQLPSSYAPNLDERSSSQRLSLPLSAGSNRPQRVLEDASQHFRPFVPRDPDYRSPFSNHSVGHDSLEPSPVSEQIFSSNSSRRVSDLQPRNQLAAASLYNLTWNPTPPPQPPPLNSSTFVGSSSSPSNASRSSPTARLSVQRQAQVAGRPSAPSTWSQRLQLDLDHAPKVPPLVNNTRLVDPRQALPDQFRSVFPYELFNVVQSKCFPLVYGTNDNVVISAPTGSGKTAVLEMAICKLASSVGGDNFKIVYQAPTKSLCSERARDWERKFRHMNMRCIELTGDTSHAQASRVGSASIIVTTPEKWDSITRKWSDHRKLLDLIRLVLIDEVHFLKDVRGATLEAVVSRMKTIGANVRFVALSATIPNIEDVAKWLGRDHGNQHEPAKCVAFGEDMRPVKLQRYVYGYEGSPNGFIFDKLLDGKLTLLLAKHSEMKPIMVFCFTRKSCQRTARILAEWWSTCRPDDKAWPAPTQRIPVISQELQEIVRFGVAFHHAGLDAQDRAAVAQNFLSGQLHVICCTSTLAVGVNLPCHTVVLKGTTGYSDNGAQEYSDLEVMQMLGRAGRPQFDSSAAAIIMTRHENIERYEKMISGSEMVESTLHQNLVEHLNSEIGLGTIQDMPTAKRWINGTFLSVRIRQSPALYNLENIQNAAGAEERMEEWCERDIKLLQQCGLVTKQTPFSCTEYGLAMSRYMVQFETMKLLLSIPRGAKSEEILSTLCKASEFREFRFKPTERTLFRELNKSPFILYPIKETLTQTWHKISLIVQIHLGGVELPNEKEFGLLKADIAREKTLVFDRLNRLIRCFVDCKAFDGDGIGTKAGLELARAIAANSWESKPWQLSQIPGFGPVAVRKWISNGVHTVLGVADKSFVDIERISSRKPPYGKNLLKVLDNFPRLTMRTELIKPKSIPSQPNEMISVMLKVNLGHCNPKHPPTWAGKVPAVTFMALTTDGNLVSFWRGNIKKLDKATGLDLKFPVTLSGPNETITCYFSCEEIVGTQLMKTLDPEIPASAFRNSYAQERRSQLHGIDPLDDESEFDDLADEDMLNVFEHSGQLDQSPEYEGPLDEIEENFPFIDQLLAHDSPPPAAEPERMENGKWMCNHHCRNGNLTKSGKPCTHRCCHEGMDRPRPSQKKRGTEEKGGTRAGGEYSTEEADMDSYKDRVFEDAYTNKRISLGASKAKTATDLKHRGANVKRGVTDVSRNHDDPESMPRQSKKLCLQEGYKPPTGTNSEAIPRFKKDQSTINAHSDIECIDLSMISEDESNRSDPHTKANISAQKDQKRLLELHEKVQSSDLSSKRLTKSHRPAEHLSTRNQYDEMTDCRASDTTNPAHNGGDHHNSGNVLKRMSEELSDLSDLPELNELIDSNELPAAQPSQGKWDTDETLYPGVVHTLKEIDELQKAPERFDLSPVGKPNHEAVSPSASSVMAFSTPHIEESSSPFLSAHIFEPDLANNRGSTTTSRFIRDEEQAQGTVDSHQPEPIEDNPCQANMEADNDIVSQPNEPAWLSEFDPEFINSLRGCVNFVD